MAGTATPPPAPPAAPPAPPTAPIAPPTPPGGPPPQGAPNPDSDPNLAMSQIVARSREKHAAGAPATPPAAKKAPETPPPAALGAPATPPEPPPAEPQKLTDLLGKALKFTPAKPQTPPAAAPAAPPAPAAPAAPPAAEPPAPPAEPAAGKKPAKSKKAVPQADPTAVAIAAATAATETAMRAIHSTTAPPKPSPTDALSDDDKRDYEVAQHLARMDPRYADAPKIILDHVARAEDYAARWEAANPGKEFDATDDAHDEFFSTLQRPWTANDFNEAKIDLSAEKKLEKFKAEQNDTLQGLHQDQARMELAPQVDRKFNEVTGEVAMAVGEDVHKILTTSGWEGLHKSDPITAQVLAATLDQLHPFVEAAIEIDDPRRRVRIDVKGNQSHAHWNQVVSVGEASLVGQTDDNGKMFARRADYVKMTPAQQSAHWYLTTDMIIKGAMDYAAEQAKTVAKANKEKLKSLGFVRQEPVSPPSGASPAPQGAANTHAPPPTPAAEKPVSPPAGGGSKIDVPDGGSKSGEAALMQQISGILFR